MYSFYKGNALSLYFVILLFYSPANTSGFRLLGLSVKTFGLEKTCLFISSRLERAGGLGPPPPFATRGPFEEGYEGDFARDFLLRVGEDIFIPLVIVIVIVVIVRKQSVKAEQRRSREAQKLKSKRESKGRGKQSTRKNNKQSKQGRAASESLKREKRSRQSEKQKSKEAREAEKQRSRKAEKQKSRGKQKKY